MQITSASVSGSDVTVTVQDMGSQPTGTDVYLGQNTQAIAGSLQPGTRVALQTPTGAIVASFTVPNG